MNKSERIMIIEICGKLDIIIGKLLKNTDVQKCASELNIIKECLLKNKQHK